jgi:tight adherence protein C
MSMLIPFLVVVAVIAVSTAAYAVLGERQRSSAIARALPGEGVRQPMRTPILHDQDAAGTPLRAFLRRIVPASWVEDAETNDKLTQAGFDSARAALTFASFRLAAFVVIPAMTYAMAPRTKFTMFLGYLAASAFAAYIMPVGFLDRRVRQRQERIRRATPDALDLLVVCVEAGISLDAAVLRVSRDLATAHPDLCAELLVVNRKMNAGVTREDALKGLWKRTGVEELKALVSSMIQSEKWGTSIAKVLRVNAETLRRKRRQSAEQKAQKAPVKMIFPLVTMILPALFVVILGPAGIQISKIFSSSADK